MNDTISRTAAMTMPVLPKEHRDYISFELDDIYEQGWNECQKSIAELPSVDRPKGEWVYHENNMLCVRWNKWECDQCHERVEYKYNFCPNCGADMRVKE